MMRRFTLLTACLAAALLMSTNAHAWSGDKIVSCDSCSTSYAFQNKALNSVGHGTNRVYVVNRNTRTINRYYVVKESEPGYTLEEAILIQKDAGDVSEINNALDGYHYLKNLSDVDYDEVKPHLPSQFRGFDSATDIAGTWQRRNAFANAVSEWASDGFIDVLTATVNTALQFLTDGLYFQVVLHMPDGSYYIFKFEGTDWSSPQPFAQYEAWKGYDNQGLQIPETSSQLNNSAYEGGQNYVDNYGDLATRLGYTLDQLNNCGRVTLRIVCTSGPPRVCTYNPVPACP